MNDNRMTTVQKKERRQIHLINSSFAGKAQ